MEGAMVALAAQGEDNFARNDLALLEISAGDHRIEILDNNRRARSNYFLFDINIHKFKHNVLRFFGGGWRL